MNIKAGEFAGEPIVAAYDHVNGNAMAYSRLVDGVEIEFY